MTYLITSKYGCHTTDNWRKLREKWPFFRVKILAEACIVNLTCENRFAFIEKSKSWLCDRNICPIAVFPRLNI